MNNIFSTKGQIELRKSLDRLTIRPSVKKKICKNHIFSVWQEGYDQCFQGWRLKQPCEELDQTSVEEGGE